MKQLKNIEKKHWRTMWAYVFCFYCIYKNGRNIYKRKQYIYATGTVNKNQGTFPYKFSLYNEPSTLWFILFYLFPSSKNTSIHEFKHQITNKQVSGCCSFSWVNKEKISKTFECGQINSNRKKRNVNSNLDEAFLSGLKTQALI